MALTKTGYVSETEYRRLALGNGQLELHRGQLREKPGMSVEHGSVADNLLRQLYRQLDAGQYRLRTNFAKLRRSADTYDVPDVVVIPAGMVQALRERPGSLDAYPDPLPLVVEIWSPSTGDYDIVEKLPDYQHRGDRDLVHPPVPGHPHGLAQTPGWHIFRNDLPSGHRLSRIAARRCGRSGGTLSP